MNSGNIFVCVKSGILRVFASDLAHKRAVKVRALLVSGARQVRLFAGEMRTYPAIPPRGYGVHGELVGVYTSDARLEWIEDDLTVAMQGDKCAAA